MVEPVAGFGIFADEGAELGENFLGLGIKVVECGWLVQGLGGRFKGDRFCNVRGEKVAGCGEAQGLAVFFVEMIAKSFEG